jgi:hypothetical protein
MKSSNKGFSDESFGYSIKNMKLIYIVNIWIIYPIIKIERHLSLN